jgi:hypothetical protein
MRKLLLAVVFVAGVAASPSAALATDANGNHKTYIWIVGAGTPNDTAKAPDGSTIAMTGIGTLSAGPDKMAHGGGTFRTSGGSSGHWTATAVQGFVSYGQTPGFPIPGATGGLAKLKVSLDNGMSGVLAIFCILGTPPPSVMEGITVILGAGPSAEYTEPDGGFTLFIAA